MTVYNGMPYLREAVESILTQSLREFVFLVLNNGSTDGSGEYLADLEKRRAGARPLLRVRHLPENIGRTAVLNTGLELVETEVTAIIDADDVAMPRRLEKQAAFLRDHPEIDLVGSDVTYINSAGRRVGEDSFPADHRTLCNRLPLYNQFAHAACAFRTPAARAVGGYPSEYPYAQDMGLWIAMLRNGSMAGNVREPLAGIRIHRGQATGEKGLRVARMEDDSRLADAMFGIPGLSSASRQAACFRGALALFRLGRKKQAFRQLWRGFWEAPLLLPWNPILWERLTLERKRGDP
jgi:glycosyltransferase involved in cell wall biosynthesis